MVGYTARTMLIQVERIAICMICLFIISYESPMTLITNELMRRTAPPPYVEAMQRSRPFEEVQSEYLAALEQRRNEEMSSDMEGLAAEEQSVASASVRLPDTAQPLLYL